MHNSIIRKNVHPAALVELRFTDLLITAGRRVEANHASVCICDRLAADRALRFADEGVLMLTHADLRSEREVDHALGGDIVQHVPRGFFRSEPVFDIDMSDASAAALLIEQGAETAFFLNRAFLHQRDPLVRVNEVFVLLKEQIVCLTKMKKRRNTLCISRF